MFTLIKRTILVLACVPNIVFANDLNNVWLPFPGGNLDAICRRVWHEYDEKFKEESVITVKQGADSILATKDMVNSLYAKNFMCAPSSTFTSNQLAFPGVDSGVDKIEPIIQMVRFPVVWYAPNTNKTTGLQNLITYLKTLGRTVNVGVFNGPGRVTASFLEKKYQVPVNRIQFKNVTQMYSSLSDGSIDLAFDTGGSVSFAESGRFRIIGYASPDVYERLAKYRNFIQDDKELRNIQTWLGIAVPKTMDNKIKTEAIAKLKLIITDQKFKDSLKDLLGSASGIVQPEFDEDIKKQSIMNGKYWE